MPVELKQKLLSGLGGKELIDIKTIHKDSEGNDVFFDLDDESDGTRKLFSFAGPWLDSLKHGKVLFIDENLEKAYLAGRYGALPLVSNLEYIGVANGK